MKLSKVIKKNIITKQENLGTFSTFLQVINQESVHDKFGIVLFFPL